MTDEELFKIIKKHCPVNLSYRQDGGLLDPCKIEGTLGDVLDFVKAIYTEGFYDAELDGYNEGWESSNVSTEINRQYHHSN